MVRGEAVMGESCGFLKGQRRVLLTAVWETVRVWNWINALGSCVGFPFLRIWGNC